MAQSSGGQPKRSGGQPNRSSSRGQRGRTGRGARSEPQRASLSRRVSATFPDALVWSLLFARWLLPTEGGAQGETLWLTSLTLFAAALVCWIRSRSGWVSDPTASDRNVGTESQPTAAARRSLTKLDFAALLLCGSHVFAALLVLIDGGNRRTAINLGWEWLSLAVLFLLLRHSGHSPLRPVLVRAVTAIWIALAGYGIWQHAIWYPATLQSYEQARSKYDAAFSAATSPNAPAAAQQELRQATADLTARGVPLSGPSRELFERRLRDSQEPLGFFALANSFAGCLSVIVVLLTVLLVRSLLSSAKVASTSATAQSANPARAGPASPAGRRRVIRVLAILLPLLLTTACLILTKSRTAWCGTLAGLALAAGLSFFGNRSELSLRRGILIAGGLLIAIGGLATATTLTGGLDPNVIREAPKSLKYRLEYWSGSLAVVAEHPMLGVGPGQFRDAYLKHKLPESSEEIADAHQAVLDVWANAGLPALLGLLGVVVFSGVNIVKRGRSHESGWTGLERGTSEAPASGNSLQPTLVLPAQSSPGHPAGSDLTGLLAILIAFGIVLAANFILEAHINSHALTVGIAAVACWWLLKPVFASSRLDASHFTLPLGGSRGTTGEGAVWRNVEQQTFATRTFHVAVSSGLVALLVHLQGAGGIAMPAVVGLLLLLAVLTDADTPQVPTASGTASAERPPRWTLETYWSTSAVVTAVLSVVCSLTAFVPDQSRRSLLAAGDYEAAQGRAVPQAERLYHEAAQADVLSPEPWLRLSELAFRQWSTTGSEPEFDRGLEAARQAINRSPRTASFKHHLGHWLLDRAERENDPNRAHQSVEWLAQAVAGYRTEPQWLADLALAQHAAGDTQHAAATAKKALDLDALNRKAGHIDRYLDNETLSRLAEVVAGSHRPEPGLEHD